jgi:hypothetical protein
MPMRRSIDNNDNAMTRTYRVDISKKWIDTLRNSPLRSFRQAESRYHLIENRELGYKPRSRHLLSPSNLTSSNEDVPKGICSDKWAEKIRDRSSKLDYIRYSKAALTPMSPYQDDDFSKAYTTSLYQTKGTVNINVRVKSDENLEVDLLFISNLENQAWETEDLGLFDHLMRVHPTIFVEHYSGYLKPQHVIRCVTRYDLYSSGEEKEAKKRNEIFTEEQKPFTWILTTGCSKKLLQSFGAIQDEELGAGVYRLPTGLNMGIVVIKDLPETPETLWLRGLGKDRILTRAFENIRELPTTRRERNDILEVCIKHFKYLSEKSATGLTPEEEDFMKTMQDIDTLYKSEMNRARLEGELQLIFRQLKRRVGNLSIDLEARVKALPLERLDELGEALLDFTQMGDLLTWLDGNV